MNTGFASTPYRFDYNTDIESLVNYTKSERLNYECLHAEKSLAYYFWLMTACVFMLCQC